MPQCVEELARPYSSSTNPFSVLDLPAATWWDQLPYGSYGVLGGALAAALMRGGGGVWTWYWGRAATLQAEAERKRRNAAAAERMAQSAERRHARAAADLALRQREQQQRQQQSQRASFQAAGRQSTQDIEMGVMGDVDLGDATTPPYTPPNPQPPNGEQT